MSGSSDLSVAQQFTFGESGDLEPSEESVETSLEHFGADVDHRERSSCRDRPVASQFGVDDRPEVERSESGEQGALFADTSEDQRTLTGERAAARCLFTDGQPIGSDRSEGASNGEERG